MRLHARKPYSRQAGFTLTEILVALALGLFLTGVVIAIFTSSQSTFRTVNEVSRSQENTRFALSFLRRNMRMAGYTNCSDDVSKRNFLDLTSAAYIPSMEHAVFGWEFNGTSAGDDYTLNYESLRDDFVQADVTAARANNTAGADSWRSRFIRSVAGTTLTNVTLPDEIVDYEPLRGSDIIAVSISTPLEIFVEDQFTQTNPILDIVDFEGDSTPSDVDQGQILKIADCSSVDLFQNSATDADTFIQIDDGGAAPGNDFNATFAWQKSWGEFSNIYAVDTSVFFIGTGAGGRPSLYQWTSGCGLAAGCDADAVELVEGVENMQILYGEDTSNDGVVNEYVSADQVSNYGNVKSVKIGLIMRSPDNGATGIDDTLTYTLLDTTTINPPDDNYLRYVSNATVYLRNTGL
ncbi:PilW family protein [Arenicella sp.]|nr:PilW family protein [Arenicella sp.]